MTSEEAAIQYADQIKRMTDLYWKIKWGTKESKPDTCPEDIMEAEVPEKHWAPTRVVLIDGIRKCESDTRCIFCDKVFTSQHMMLSHRGQIHGEEVKAWRLEGVPRDYTAGMTIQGVMQKYNLRRSAAYKVLEETNTKRRELDHVDSRD